MLIAEEGARLLGNTFAFSACGVSSRMLINAQRVKGRPQRHTAEAALGCPLFAECLDRKSTAKFNRAASKKN
jgi:hypothetical protein